MADNYEVIATTTLTSAASTITFSSIPGTYTDLRLVFVSTSSGGNGSVILNQDTGTNYSTTVLIGDGISGGSQRSTNRTDLGLSQGNIYANNSIPSLVTFDFFNYAGSTFKTVLLNYSQEFSTDGRTAQRVSLWRNTSAITRIDFTRDSGTYSIGTTATIYGIKAGA
jgi:hypothetical protein